MKKSSYIAVLKNVIKPKGICLICGGEGSNMRVIVRFRSKSDPERTYNVHSQCISNKDETEILEKLSCGI